MADSTLVAIRKKVRLLTRSPSSSQLTSNEIDEYINTFILYDFPGHLHLTSFKQIFSFYTRPYIDVYSTNTVNADDPLYNLKNVVITNDVPVYIAGTRAYFTQSYDDFFTLYPSVQLESSIGTGDGINATFNGTLDNVPVLQNSVLFTAIDANYNGIILKDVPQVVAGAPTVNGDLVVPNDATSRGSINYVTGVYNFTFTSIPADSSTVYAQTVSYTESKPNSVLYFDNKFTVRPVPDHVYKISMEAFVRPSELLGATSKPELEQYWQYIAYGAAKKIFEDRMDTESIAQIMPEFKEQELLCGRRTLVQQSNQRVATIYTTPGERYNDILNL
jgi:hypothetical protein